MEENNPTYELIKNRRSLRSYSKKVIDEEIKSKIIHGAIRAPTGGNMMSYSILEVKDKAIKEKLVDTCGNLSFIANSPFVLIFLADWQRWHDYFNYSGIERLCTQLNIKSPEPQAGDLLISICDAVIAAHNASIVAESFGIGSCYVGNIVENIEIHRKMFNLAKWTFPISMLCFGYPKRKIKPLHMSPRFDEKYIHFQDSYRRFTPPELEKMIKDNQFPEFHPKGYNYGQQIYLDMITEEYLNEINRSSRKILDNWLGGD